MTPCRASTDIIWLVQFQQFSFCRPPSSHFFLGGGGGGGPGADTWLCSSITVIALSAFYKEAWVKVTPLYINQSFRFNRLSKGYG